MICDDCNELCGNIISFLVVFIVPNSPLLSLGVCVLWDGRSMYWAAQAVPGSCIQYQTTSVEIQ